MDIVEMVARALCVANGHDPDLTYDIWVPDDPVAGHTWASYRTDARAAIRATLEHYRDNVSEGMVDAAHDVVTSESSGDGYGNVTDLEISGNAVAAVFRQALKELDRSEGLTGS